MKVLLLAVVVLGSAIAALAEPAFRRQQSPQASQEQQDAEDAPYPASGWKPAGQRLEQPERQYGVAEKEEDATAEPQSATETPPAEAKKAAKTPKQAPKSEQQVAQGEYYVILPDGRLQRVQFAAKLEAKMEVEHPSDEQQRQKASDEEAVPHGLPRSGTRPAPRPQPAPKAQASLVAAPQYLVILPDGRVQPAEFIGRLEMEQQMKEAHQEDADADDDVPAPSTPRRGAAVRPQAGQQRPQPEKFQSQPVFLVPQRLQEGPMAPGTPSSFVAELRFMEVPPITGPVYSYSGPLVRVQREVLAEV